MYGTCIDMKEKCILVDFRMVIDFHSVEKKLPHTLYTKYSKYYEFSSPESNDTADQSDLQISAK